MRIKGLNVRSLLLVLFSLPCLPRTFLFSLLGMDFIGALNVGLPSLRDFLPKVCSLGHFLLGLFLICNCEVLGDY